MGIVKDILDYRLNVDVEYQGWILLFATMFAVYLFCLPCACAGSSSVPLRRLALKVQKHLPLFYITMACINGGFMYVLVAWLPDWTFSQYIDACMNFGIFLAAHMLKWATSLAIIIAAAFVFAFKDRFLLLMGLDHRTLFKCKMRDVMTCWSGDRFRAIELMIWKVEDLQSADMFNPNNVYIEVFFGYNESMKTRVHNNAGNACVLRESIQLNFDDVDDEEHMFVFVRNQKIVGGSELGRLELKGDQVAQIEREVKPFEGGQVKWDKEYFVSRRLIPRGTIWFRVNPIDDVDAARTC